MKVYLESIHPSPEKNKQHSIKEEMARSNPREKKSTLKP
jgi:hypothetical protein